MARRRSKVTGNCILCGGLVPATVPEHAPPKILFIDKYLPKDHEFPSCSRCNHGSSQLDQVAAMMVFSTAEAFFPGRFIQQFEKASKGVANNVPEVIHLIDTDGPDQKFAIDNPHFPDLLAVPVEKRLFTHWLNPWAVKQTLGMWYKQCGKPVSADQVIFVRWIPSILDLDQKFIELISRALPSRYALRQGRVSFEDQFFYHFAFSEDGAFGGFYSVYHNSISILSTVMSHADAARNPKLGFGDLFQVSPNLGIHRVLGH